MSTLKIGSRYRESPMPIVPSVSGFPLVFKSARTRGRCRLSTKFEIAMMVAALWMAAVSPAPSSAAGSDYHITAGRASAVHECSILAGRYSQHDWGNTEIRKLPARNRNADLLLRSQVLCRSLQRSHPGTSKSCESVMTTIDALKYLPQMGLNPWKVVGCAGSFALSNGFAVEAILGDRNSIAFFSRQAAISTKSD
jgi:hypothetical protein